MNKKEEFISLKEAAKLSGYSSDYIGQLIRSGKIGGKQMYTNVSWVTTERAVLEYLDKSKGEKADAGSVKMTAAFKKFLDEYLLSVANSILWIAVAILALFLFLLLYIFFVTLDRSIEQQTLIEYKHEGIE